jgi:hypothetical protein
MHGGEGVGAASINAKDEWTTGHAFDAAKNLFVSFRQTHNINRTHNTRHRHPSSLG